MTPGTPTPPTAPTRAVATPAALAVMAAVALLVVPLPSAALDLLLALQLAGAVMVLWWAATAREPARLAVFPTVLLLATLGRLALNVATTRAILGRGDAGRMVEAFGDAVVEGDLLVGLAVFAVVTLAQYGVVARGAGRVAEVAARFALDALPGRQAAIDAEVAAGRLDAEGARTRRAALARVSGLYGAMDGAMRFVRGDALVGVCIVGVNIGGGLMVGLRDGAGLDEALATYTVLTVGDGLLAQVPAVLITGAAAILATRIASPEAGGRIEAPPWAGVAALFAALALVPGLPAPPLLVVAGAAAGLMVLARRSRRPDPAPARAPRSRILRLVLHPTALDAIGAEHFDAVVERARRRLVPYGVDLPAPARILDATDITPGGYRIEVDGAAVARGILVAGHVFVCPRPTDDGIAGRHPHHDAPGRWVTRGAGIDPAEYFVTHLAATWRRCGAAALPLQTVARRVARLEQAQPALVRAVVPRRVDLPALAGLLRALLAEDLSIAELAPVFEALAAQSVEHPENGRLIGLRRALAAHVVARAAPSGWLAAIYPSLDVEVGWRAGAAVESRPLVDAVDALRAVHPGAALLVPDDVRDAARAGLSARPGLPILAAGELGPDVDVRMVGLIGE